MNEGKSMHRVKCNTYDENWKSGLPCIPKDSKVEYIEVYRNLFDTFAKVRYDNKFYYIKLEYIEYTNE